MCGHCGRSEKSKHRRNALVVIDRGDKEDCCCLQRTDIKLQAFFTLKRREERLYFATKYSLARLLRKPTLSRALRLDVGSVQMPRSFCPRVICIVASQWMGFCVQNTKSIPKRERAQSDGPLWLMVGAARPTTARHETWAEILNVPRRKRAPFASKSQSL